MIALLRGQVALKEDGCVIVDVGGVGYLVRVPEDQIFAMVLGGDVQLHVVTVVREDAFDLFGFNQVAQRHMFNLLRSVKGIGPKVALGLLSSLSAEDIAGAVVQNNTSLLTGVKGVGRQMAQRMCLELKERVSDQVAHRPMLRVVGEDPLILALSRLDYKKSEISRVLQSPDVVAQHDAPLGDRLSQALRVLSRPA
jgi:Holliday junction DNA helicase RuvA